MANKIEEIRGSIDASLKDESKPWTQFFKLAEEKTNVPRLYIFLGKFCRFPPAPPGSLVSLWMAGPVQFKLMTRTMETAGSE